MRRQPVLIPITVRPAHSREQRRGASRTSSGRLPARPGLLLPFRRMPSEALAQGVHDVDHLRARAFGLRLGQRLALALRVDELHDRCLVIVLIGVGTGAQRNSLRSTWTERSSPQRSGAVAPAYVSLTIRNKQVEVRRKSLVGITRANRRQPGIGIPSCRFPTSRPQHMRAIETRIGPPPQFDSDT